MSEAKAALDPVEPPKPLTLAEKILDIQDRVGVVKKIGKFDSAMGGGNYLRIEDAVVAVNKLMTSHKLFLTGEVTASERIVHERTGKDGTNARSGYITGVTMRWRLEDTQSGDYREYMFRGDGYDSTDKSIYKAMTGCRKYAIINIFNLPIGNDVEEHGAPSFDESKKMAKKVGDQKLAKFAAAGNKTAIDTMSQIEPDRKILIKRPEEQNGHFITVEGLIAVPQLEQFFEDTDCRRFKRKSDLVPYWRVPSEYEAGLIRLCENLKIEVEG